jgi:hypothetical protein
MADPKYGTLDGLASRYNEREAWVLDETRTEWNEINKGSHAHGVREMTKEAFDRSFPKIPALPADAFKA